VGDYVVVMQGDAQFKAGTSGRIVGFNHKGKAVIKADDKVALIACLALAIAAYFFLEYPILYCSGIH
jgi:hypothetical protein